MSLKDDLLSLNDFYMEPARVPKWPDTVFVREMSVPERIAWYELNYEAGKPRNGKLFREGLLVFCLCDADGTRIFADDDAPLLHAKSPKNIDALFQMAMRVNRMGEAEETAKKSASALTDDSASSLPGHSDGVSPTSIDSEAASSANGRPTT